MSKIDIEKNIKQFMKDRNPMDRYTSFDYCFNYFHSFKDKKDIVSPKNIQNSCLHLGFYLASWGMYRGASFLLQHSIKIYEKLLREVIVDKKHYKLRNIDVNNYNEENIIILLQCYKKIKNLLIGEKRHIVLTTKIMLGIFGCIPAYDRYFQKGFKKIYPNECGFTSVNRESLMLIKKFYNNEYNKSIIDKYSEKIKLLDFKTGKETKISYTKAKIIDMIGFTYGKTAKKGLQKIH